MPPLHRPGPRGVVNGYAATSNFLGSDPGFSLEKALVDMALQKGVIEEEEHGRIISDIDDRPKRDPP